MASNQTRSNVDTDNGNGQRSKRQRISLACDSCRARKTRCNGARPQCNVCVDMDFNCNYQRPPRGSVDSSQEKGSMSRFDERLLAMENLLKTLAQKSDGSDFSSRSPTTLRAEQGGGTSTSHYYGDRENSSAQVSGTALIADKTQQNGTVPEPVLHEDTVDGMGTITFFDERASGYFGPTSNSAFFRHIAHALSRDRKLSFQPTQAIATNQSIVDHISRPPSPKRFSSVTQLTGPELHRFDDKYTLPPKPEITQLVDTFFANFGSKMFPYIYKQSVLGTLAVMGLSNVHDFRPSWLCLLNAIMAFATSLTDNTDSDISNASVTKADCFLERALKMLSIMNNRPANLETLQALLLVTQYIQGTRRSAQTWNLQRLTVQIAYQVGVHSNANSASLTPLEQEIRKRSWYMCYVLDKTCSMTYGRPPSIQNSNILMDLPLDVELEDLDQRSDYQMSTPSQHSFSSVTLYIQSIKIYQIVGDIINEVYQKNTETDTAMRSSDLIMRILPIEKKLGTWKSELPQNLQVNSQSELFTLGVPPVPLRLNAVITLRYLNTRILLHRSILERFLDYDSSKDRNVEDLAFLQRFGKGSVEVCIEAASEMIDIIDGFSNNQRHVLTTWWFIIYYTFSSALVVFGALIALRENKIVLPNCQHHDLMDSLHKALRSLERIENGKRMATRCQKYLEKLIQLVVATERDQMPTLQPVVGSALHGSLQPDLDFNSLEATFDWGDLFPLTETQGLDSISHAF